MFLFATDTPDELHFLSCSLLSHQARNLLSAFPALVFHLDTLEQKGKSDHSSGPRERSPPLPGVQQVPKSWGQEPHWKPAVVLVHSHSSKTFLQIGSST